MIGRRLVLALALVSVTVAACGSAPAPRTGSAQPAATAAVPVRSGASDGIAVRVDPGLIDHLPDSVAGLELRPSPESDATASSDPVVRANAEAVATALAIDPADGEFAHATVVRLRPDVFEEEFFRDWRDTFDAGACSQAGELVRTAEAVIGGRRTFIGTCSGGAHTYHVWLAESRVLVSITSIGERRLGERLAGELNE